MWSGFIILWRSTQLCDGRPSNCLWYACLSSQGNIARPCTNLNMLGLSQWVNLQNQQDRGRAAANKPLYWSTPLSLKILSLWIICFWIQWFELYPEHLSNPFYISGESYAGVYVPTLASKVVEGTANSTNFQVHLSSFVSNCNWTSLSGIKKGEKPLINFKVPISSSHPLLNDMGNTQFLDDGFDWLNFLNMKKCTLLQGYLIGNGIADDEYDGNGHVPFLFGMALISSNIFEVG